MGFSFSGMFADKTKMVEEKDALPGRDEPMMISGVHFVTGNTMVAPFPQGLEVAYFAMGCFWGAEKLFWELDGVFVTAVGYQGGYTKNPTYEESCTALTGHAEAVMVVFDPFVITYRELVTKFFEGHDPTQYMRQGGDVGTQYRSAIFPISKDQYSLAHEVMGQYNKNLIENGFSKITTEVTELPTPRFYYAEEYHQQYLAKNPGGYCGLRGTGVACPTV